MKRPLLLVVALAALATLVTLLVVWISRPPADGSTTAESGATAGARDRAEAFGIEAVSIPGADELAAPAAAEVARSNAPDAAALEAGPKVAIEGRVSPPSGCSADDTVEVVAVSRRSSVAEVIRGLHPRAKRASAVINPTDGTVIEEDDPAPDAGYVIARAPMRADGGYRLEVPAALESAHVLAVGRSWYGKDTEEWTSKSAARLQLVTHCGAWIEGTVAVPTGRALDEVEGIPIELTTSTEDMAVAMQGGGVRRFAKIEDGKFEFRALPPAPAYDLSGTPARLAGTQATTAALVAGRGTPVLLAFREGGIVRGTVRDSSGAGIADAVVTANQKGRWFGFDDRSVRNAKTSADGAFELVGVSPGKVEVKAAANGWLVDKPVKLDVVDGVAIDGVAIVLDRGATIAGTLRWPEGAPAADVRVDVRFDQSQMAGMGAFNMLKGPSGNAQTDAEGRFAVSGLGPGPFVVESFATPPGAAAVERDEKGDWKKLAHRARADLVKPGTKDLALVLMPPTGVRGRVVGTDDAPVVAFEVDANGVGEGMLAEVGQEQRSEDFESETGAFLLTGLHDGKWKMVVEAEGYSPSLPLEFETPIAKDAPELVIRLERAAVVKGVVRGPDGAPVAGATVSLDDGNPQWMRALSRARPPEARSDETGAFVLDGLRPGSIAIVAQHDDHARSVASPLELAAGQVVEGVALVLLRGGRITGEVFHDGKPAVNMLVQITETKRFAQRSTTTDAKGLFDVAHVDPGSYQVVAMPLRGPAAGDDGEFDPMSMMSDMKMATTDVVDGGEVHLVLGAPPEDPVKVVGTVSMAGAPVANATVMFFPETGKKGLAAFKPVQTKKDGTYAVTLDAPGAYSVSVQRMSAQMDSQMIHEERRVIPKAAESSVDIVLPEGRISGRVIAPDGNPAPRARVSVVAEGTGRVGTMWGGQFHELHTNQDGEYDATGIPPGTYSVAAGGTEMGGMLGDASATGGRQIQPGIVVGEKDWRRNVDFRLKAPGVVSVTVVDESGRPVTDAVIFARDENGRPVDLFSFTTTDGTGTAKYGGLSSGRYTFRARSKGTASAETSPVRVEEGGKAETRITLEKGTTVLVKVVDGEKNPLVASIEVLDENGRDVARQISLAEIMERFQSGGFDSTERRFGPFPAGKYKVRVTTESGKTDTKTVTLNGQAERKVTIELD